MVSFIQIKIDRCQTLRIKLIANPSINNRIQMSHQNFCSHIQAVTEVKQPEKRVCEECIRINGRWLHLRTCQTCGVTLCCDDSPNTHMTKHYHSTHHPVVASAEPGERWLWCYEDEQFAEY